MYSISLNEDIKALGYFSKAYFKFEKCQMNIFQLLFSRFLLAINYLQSISWMEDLVTVKYVNSFPDLGNFRLWLFLNDHIGYLEAVDPSRGIYNAILIIPGAYFWQAKKYKIMLILNKDEKNQTIKFPFK